MSAPIDNSGVMVESNTPNDEVEVVLILVFVPHLVGNGLPRSTEGDTKTLTAAVDSDTARRNLSRTTRQGLG